MFGREAEVAGTDRGGHRGEGRGDVTQVVVEGGAVPAGGDQGGGGLEVGPLGIAGRVGGDQELVMGDVVGRVWVAHRDHPSSPRNRPMWPSSRSRSARRPRWIRDFTVPSETPVNSAISA